MPLHVFYRAGLRPIYSRFLGDAPVSVADDYAYRELISYDEVTAEVRSFVGPFVAEVTLPVAAALLAELQGTDRELLVIGTMTAFAENRETSALFHPAGRASSVEHLDGARPESVATWLALMYLKQQKAPIVAEPAAVCGRLRDTDERNIFDYVLRALRAGVTPLLQGFLALGHAKQLQELKVLSRETFDHVDLFDWYRGTTTCSRLNLYSRLAVARRSDWTIDRSRYDALLDQWESWKAVKTKPGQPLDVLASAVRVDRAHADGICAFLRSARLHLGDGLLAALGISAPALSLAESPNVWESP